MVTIGIFHLLLLFSSIFSFSPLFYHLPFEQQEQQQQQQHQQHMKAPAVITRFVPYMTSYIIYLLLNGFAFCFNGIYALRNNIDHESIW